MATGLEATHARAGMGTRRKSSRPRRSPPETETLASSAETRPRKDVKISRRDRDETFLALEK